MFRYIGGKMALTIPATFWVVSEDHRMIICGLVLIVLIDTVLGLWVSVKHGVFASYKMSRVASKVSRYCLAMLSVWVLERVEPGLFGWAFRAMGVFLILTEVFSNFEKLAILGLEVPTKLLARLNGDFREFYFGEDEEKRHALKRILNKEQGNKI